MMQVKQLGRRIKNGKKKFTEHDYQGNVSVNSRLNVKKNCTPVETKKQTDIEKTNQDAAFKKKRSFNSLKQTKLELNCPNCKLMFKNLQQHLEASLICKQTVNKKITAEKVNEVVKPMKLQELNSPKMNKTKTMKQKCRGCLKEFSNLNYHISKSFLCQNNYIDEDDETRGQKGLSFKEDYPKKETVDVQIKKAEIEVSKDMKIQETMRLSSLDSETWLNDEIVNQYMKLLNTLDTKAFMFSTFFPHWI